MASNKNASKKAMAKKAARKKALAKKAALGLDQGTSAFSRDESHSIFTQMNTSPGFEYTIDSRLNVSPDGAVSVQYKDLDDLVDYTQRGERRNMAIGKEVGARYQDYFDKTAQANDQAGIKYFLIKIKVKNAPYPLWRRMVLSADSHFSELHAKIQEEFRWDNDHMSFFCLDDNRRKEFCATRIDPWTFEPDPQLREVLRQGARIGYIFDFFEEKQHLIEVEKAMSDANDYDQTLQMAKGEAFGPGSVW